MRPGNPDPIEYEYCDTCNNKISIENIDGRTCVWCIDEREEQDETLEW